MGIKRSASTPLDIRIFGGRHANLLLITSLTPKSLSLPEDLEQNIGGSA
jgi:hypothetical protein